MNENKIRSYWEALPEPLKEFWEECLECPFVGFHDTYPHIHCDAPDQLTKNYLGKCADP